LEPPPFANGQVNNLHSITSFLNCPDVYTLTRCLALFEKKGTVLPDISVDLTKKRWPAEVEAFVRKYAEAHPCFFLEELQDELKIEFPDLKNISIPTICRALRHDMGLTRKVLTKRAKEIRPQEIHDYLYRLRPLYLYPEQMVFVDETGKDSRDALRKYAWSEKGTPAVVSLSFARGKRVSTLAAFNHSGFLAWGFTPDTFTRLTFHDTFVENILPHLNKWPLPNSIVVIDNARIHMYREFMDAVASRGAVVVFLPPFCPQLNPIEHGFGRLKAWIQKHANLVFSRNPEEIMDIALECCTVNLDGPLNTIENCGYGRSELIESIFSKLLK
jgi:hypothetical protein